MAIGKYVPPPQKGMLRKGGKVKPAAPLLPLHLQAPVRTQIKPGSRFFDCVCGEHLLVRADNDKRTVQCMACDRIHILEIEAPMAPSRPPSSRETKRKGAPATRSKGPAEAPPKSPPPARSKAAPEIPAKSRPAAAPPPPARPLKLGEFLCKCGEIHPPRTSRTGKTFECKKCGRKGHVEAETDPETRLPKMRPVFTFEPAPGAPAPAAPREIPAARPAPAPKAPAAPPEAGVVAFEELAPLSISPLPATPVSDLETAIFETSASSARSDAPPAVEADAQVAICECGAEILVSPRDVGHTIQCPACSDVMTVEQTPDPRTRMPVLGVRSLGSMDDAGWKIEDFQ
jgi:DNA-directed RNA polymerase subunit M/transcription elongation factor TFIIS